MNLFACPVCRAPLELQDKQLSCAANHSFDRARQGYWNLLMVGRKRSKDPGDSAEMIQARRDFLEQGHYAPLAEQVCQQLTKALADADQPKLLDMGCGEGYYTVQMLEALQAGGKTPELIGLDISKHAVKAACKRSKAIEWIVASGAEMPVPDHSLDGLSVLFSRLMPDAFAQVLKPGGTLLLGWPGDQHLIELREMIYAEVRPSSYDPAAMLAEQFERVSVEQVSYPFTLTSQNEINTLLAMTPHSHRLPAEARASLAARDSLTLTLDVNLGLWRKK